MIVLPYPSTLESVLSGSVSSNQLPIFVNYTDLSNGQSSPYAYDLATNNTSAVTIVSAPASGTPEITRHISFLSVSNVDSASATLTLRIRTGVATKLLSVTTLAQGDNLLYDGDFKVIDSEGNIKLT